MGDKPKPFGGKQGGAKKASPPSPRKGGTPSGTVPKDSTLAKPGHTPGRGTKGRSGGAKPPKK